MTVYSLYPTETVSAMFDVSRSTVCSWVRKGWLPTIKQGKRYWFDPYEVKKFIPPKWGRKYKPVVKSNLGA